MIRLGASGKFYLAVVVIGLVLPLAITGKAFASMASQWQAGNIIDDKIFNNSSSMTTAQIQDFLDAKVPTCDTNGTQMYNGSMTRAQYGTSQGYPPPYTCLKSYQQSVPATSTDQYCIAMTSGTKTSAQIIHDVATACGVNPQDLLVTLQKEEVLVTDDWPWSSQYKIATGYGCPDTAPCDSQYYGFFNQVYHAARFFTSPPNTYLPGRYNTIRYGPDCNQSSSVYIQNQATGNLYEYTPYQPDSQVLANTNPFGSSSGPGPDISGSDSCAAYGNRNFWWLFNTWFGATHSSILFKITGSATYYLDWGGYYYPIPSGDALEAYGLAGYAPKTLGSLPSTETRGPALSRTAQFGTDGTFYLVDAGQKHGAPNATTWNDYGYSADPTAYPDSLAWLLKDGDNLRPVARRPNGAIYLMSAGKTRGFPDWTTYSSLSGSNYLGTAQVYSAQSLTNLSSTYLDTRPIGAPMLLDGRFIKPTGSPAIYLYDGGKKYLFSADAYAAWGGHTDYIFAATAMNQIADGPNAPILVKSSGGTKYLVDNGKKKSFSGSTESDWGLVDAQFTTVSDAALARLGIGAVSDLVQGTQTGVSQISAGQKHGIGSLQDFNKLGLNWSNVDILDPAALKLVPQGSTLFAPGSLLRKPNGAVLMIDSGYQALGVTSGNLFSQFGFSWSNVRNIGNDDLNGYGESSLQILLKDSSSSKYYLVDSGVAHYVDANSFGASEYSMVAWAANTVDHAVVGSIKAGLPLTQFVRGTGSTVYYIENGQRRPIPTESVFFGLGGSWDKVINVSSDFLNSIPRGSMV